MIAAIVPFSQRFVRLKPHASTVVRAFAWARERVFQADAAIPLGLKPGSIVALCRRVEALRFHLGAEKAGIAMGRLQPVAN